MQWTDSPEKTHLMLGKSEGRRRRGRQRRLSAKELMLSNCDAKEDSWESHWTKGNQTSEASRNSTLNMHWKDWCWSWISSTLATWCKEPTHWKRPWCWERLRAGGEGDDIGDGWMAPLTECTWVWANSGRGWRTGKLGVLQFMGSQRVRHDLATWQQWQSEMRRLW